jgi:mannan endo-1,4-beta-mannosidase
MGKRAAHLCTALVVLLFSFFLTAPPASAATGFTVSGGRLYDANGTEFVMRGVNHAHTWYPGETGSFADIKALGANTVRVVLSTGDLYTRNDVSDVTNVVSLCKQNRLICVLEAHDTTGFGEQSGAVSLAKAVDYWISVKNALVGQEKYVIVNIGNEPYGNNNYSSWAADTSTAIGRLRSAGFTHTLMVDAPNWGQDWSFTMRDNAASVFASDPAKNTVFSIHMYGVFDTAAEISDYLTRFVSAGLPIVVGEFGHNHSDGNPDEDSILSYAQSLRLGYLGWSWSGNGGGVEYLDMATGFDATNLTSWGQRIFNGANGIKQTAKEATVYGGGGDGGGSGACAVAYRVESQWAGGFGAKITVRNTAASTVGGWTLRWSFADGQTVTQMWNAVVTQSGAQVSATNVAYNGTILAGGSLEIGFNGRWSGGNTVPAAFSLNDVPCTAN